jgi:HK97 gp10 family phage protein
MPAAQFRLEGGQKLEAALVKLASKTQTKLLKSATAWAAKPIVKAARANLSAQKSRDTGLLRESLGVKKKFYKRSGTAIAIIGARSTGGKGKFAKIKSGLAGTSKAKRLPANYAHLVEFGTAPHFIRAAHQGVLAFLGVVTKVIYHPGSTAKPFLGPAFRSNRRRALRIIKNKLWQGIRKEAKKL